jgi:hypothetical protein
MNLVKTIEQYNDNSIYFCDPIKNNIMNESNFIRILYSTNIFTLNGIYLHITLNDIICDKYYNKYKCNFNVNNHKDLIDKIKVIEETLLKKLDFSMGTKIAQYKIYEQFKNGYIKLFQEIQNKSNQSFILKISGVWETTANYGLTYKFIKINN